MTPKASCSASGKKEPAEPSLGTGSAYVFEFGEEFYREQCEHYREFYP